MVHNCGRFYSLYKIGYSDNKIIPIQDQVEPIIGTKLQDVKQNKVFLVKKRVIYMKKLKE